MKGLPRLHSAHRIARVDYFPRVLGFAATFVAILLLTRERDLGTLTLVAAGISFLLYPQLAWLHARLRRNSKQAEIQNLLFDSLLLGLWAGGLGFNLWITFSLLASSLLNNAVNGGLPRLGLAAACFTIGGITGFTTFAPGFLPSAGLLFTGFVLSTSLLYVLGVGVTHYWQNRRLARAHKDIERKNRIFRALLHMGVLTHEATDVEILVRNALEHFRQLFPGEVFGIVLFHPERRRLLKHMAFVGLPVPEQDKLIPAMADYNEGESRQDKGVLPGPRGELWVIPMHRHLSQNTGYLVMNAGDPDDVESVLPLFIDQLGAALENKLLTQELRRAAETDGLTGLFNRAYLEEQLNEAIDQKRHHPELDFAVIMIDLIGLKRTNDTHGHHAGDRLIQVVAERLARHTRDSDVAARFGGDEFVVLCRDCTEANAVSAIERLGEACRKGQCRLTLADGRELTVPVEVSIGVAGSDRLDANRVLETADARMYENKTRWYEEHDRSRES